MGGNSILTKIVKAIECALLAPWLMSFGLERSSSINGDAVSGRLHTEILDKQAEMEMLGPGPFESLRA